MKTLSDQKKKIYLVPTAAKICLEDATKDPLMNPKDDRHTQIDMIHEYEPIIFSTNVLKKIIIC